jgi:hypothetical protein
MAFFNIGIAALRGRKGPGLAGVSALTDVAAGIRFSV